MTKQLINNYFSKVMVNDYEGSNDNLHFGGSELYYLRTTHIYTHTLEHTCTHIDTRTRFLTLFNKHFVRLAKSST